MLDTNEWIIGGTIPLSLLTQISIGQGAVTAYGGQIMKSLNKVKNVPGKVLDPFHNSEIKQAVKSIILKLSEVRAKFTFNPNDVQLIKEGFGRLFEIDAQEMIQSEKKDGRKSGRSLSGIVPKQRHLKQKGIVYSWDIPLAPYENWILFYFWYYIALAIEIYIRRSKVEYNMALGVHEPLRMTWLRIFASKKVAVCLFLGFLILFFVIKTII